MKRAIILFIAFICVTSMGATNYIQPIQVENAPREDTPEYSIPLKYFVVITDAAKDAGVPIWIAARLCDAESGFNEKCTSKNANGTIDHGLWQINSAYIAEFSWRYNDGKKLDPYNVEDSTRVALRYLARLYSATGSWEAAVASYNCGLTRYRTGSIPASTMAHVAKVFGGIK